LWQPGFFDHVLRNDESYSQKWEYVRENPVRAGLVVRADEWPYQGELVVIDRAEIFCGRHGRPYTCLDLNPVPLDELPILNRHHVCFLLRLSVSWRTHDERARST